MKRERAAARGLPPLPPSGRGSVSDMFMITQARARAQRSRSTGTAGGDARASGGNGGEERVSSRVVSSRSNAGSHCDGNRDRDV